MNNTGKTVSFKVELANKIRDGRAVGNLYGVARYINGCRNTWVLAPQDSEQAARAFCAAATADVADERTVAISVETMAQLVNGSRS